MKKGTLAAIAEKYKASPEEDLSDLVPKRTLTDVANEIMAELAKPIVPDNSLASLRGKQVDFLKDNHPKIDPELDCNTADGSLSPSTEIENLLDNVSNMGGIMRMLLDNASSKDALICEFSGNEHNGFHIYDPAIIGINPDSKTPTRSTTEEFVHMYQDHPRLDKNTYTLPDYNLWKIGTEAQAKLSVAVEAVQQKYSDDESNGVLFNEHKRGGHFAAAKFLEHSVKEHGVQALEDPEVLYGAFKKILGNSDFASSYMARFVDKDSGMDQSVGTKQFEIDDFVNFFGTVVGKDSTNNFLEGKITAKDDLVNLLPAISKFAINNQIRHILENSTNNDDLALPSLLK